MTTAPSYVSRLASVAALIVLPLALATCKLSELTTSNSAGQFSDLALSFAVQPGTGVAGKAMAPAIEVRAVRGDSAELATNFDRQVTIALVGGGSARITGTTTVTATGGIARFTDLSIDGAGRSFTLLATAAGVDGVTSTPFNVGSGGAAALAFTVQPRNTAAGVTMSPAVTVTAQDEFGNTASEFSGTVTIALMSNPIGGTLSGTRSREATAGIAVFHDLSIDKAATGYQLSAAAEGFTAVTSTGFTIVAGGGASLALEAGDLQTDSVGATLAPYAVRVTDASGNGVAGMTIQWAADGNGSITPATSTTNASGSATAVRRLGTSIGPQTATATAGALAGSPVTFTATARHGTPTTLAFLAQPSSTSAGAAITPAASVIARDQYGNTADSWTGAVVIDLDPTSGTAGAVLSGTTLQGAVAGVATFPGLSVDRAGAGYRLRAGAAGFAVATSALFVVTPGGAASLDYVSGHGQTDTVGATLAQPYVVSVRDATGNPVSGVTITWNATIGGGTMSAGTSQTDANGEARSTRTLGPTAGEQRATASASGLANSPITFGASTLPGAVVAIEFTQQPGAAAANTLIAPPVRLTLRDRVGNAVTTAGGSVSIGIVAGTGTPGAILAGTLTRAVVNGAVVFDDLRIDLAGTGYRFGVSFGSHAQQSAAFDITP